MFLFGLDIGGTKIELRAYDADMTECLRMRIPTPKDSFDNFIDAVVNIINKADVTLKCKGRVGIGIPGSESQRDKTIFAPNVPAIDGRVIRDLIESRIERPIYIDNDANCFALSESKNDELSSSDHVLGLILGTGFGAGLAVKESCYHGANNMALELGHTPLNISAFEVLSKDKEAPLLQCECGAVGCLDRYLSGTGFEDLYEYYYKERFSAPEIIEAYHNNQHNAVTFVDRFANLLSCSIAPFINAFDPDVVVFGGGLSNFDAIYPLLNERIDSFTLSRDKTPYLVKARYGDSSGVRGAALLAKPL